MVVRMTLPSLSMMSTPSTPRSRPSLWCSAARDSRGGATVRSSAGCSRLLRGAGCCAATVWREGCRAPEGDHASSHGPTPAAQRLCAGQPGSAASGRTVSSLRRRLSSVSSTKPCELTSMSSPMLPTDACDCAPIDALCSWSVTAALRNPLVVVRTLAAPKTEAVVILTEAAILTQATTKTDVASGLKQAVVALPGSHRRLRTRPDPSDKVRPCPARREARPHVEVRQLCQHETTMTYGPSFARTRRPPRGDDVRAERAPRVRGVHEALWGMPGVHVAHFSPMRLPAWNSLHPPKSPVMPPHGPHVTLRVVLGGREAQVDPSGALARARPTIKEPS